MYKCAYILWPVAVALTFDARGRVTFLQLMGLVNDVAFFGCELLCSWKSEVGFATNVVVYDFHYYKLIAPKITINLIIQISSQLP